jgi:cytochrome d ubiquinol oxidase subunit II
LILCAALLKKLPYANGKGEWLPFFIALLIFMLCFAAFGISYYPFIIPGTMTINEALSDANSLRFLLVGVVIVVPVILAYTVMVYKIFSGKSEKLSYY